jgi:hypothetical protein
LFVHKLGKDTELRLLEERHAEELADLTDRNREHLRAWLPWVDSNRTVEDHRTFIRGALEQFAGNNGFQAGIWHEGRLAGVVGFYGVDRENRSAFLGYWLGEEFQGRGLVTAACRALVDHAPPGHLLGLLDENQVPGPLEDAQPRAGDGPGQGAGVGAGHQTVVGAVDHEGRRVDVSDPARGVDARRPPRQALRWRSAGRGAAEGGGGLRPVGGRSPAVRSAGLSL